MHICNMFSNKFYILVVKFTIKLVLDAENGQPFSGKKHKLTWIVHSNGLQQTNYKRKVDILSFLSSPEAYFEIDKQFRYQLGKGKMFAPNCT